mmetsp:Transcript_35209/g.76008  ORF Transcript_35209/g.76008 Transcript_35209/m.76008 type:complete len:268 (+) Transcript_35209:163-966(+)
MIEFSPPSETSRLPSVHTLPSQSLYPVRAYMHFVFSFGVLFAVCCSPLLSLSEKSSAQSQTLSAPSCPPDTNIPSSGVAIHITGPVCFGCTAVSVVSEIKNGFSLSMTIPVSGSTLRGIRCIAPSAPPHTTEYPVWSLLCLTIKTLLAATPSNIIRPAKNWPFSMLNRAAPPSAVAQTPSLSSSHRCMSSTESVKSDWNTGFFGGNWTSAAADVPPSYPVILYARTVPSSHATHSKLLESNLRLVTMVLSKPRIDPRGTRLPPSPFS